MVSPLYALVLTVCFLLCTAMSEAAVLAEVQARDIDSMQTVQLQVRVTGTNEVEGLDLTPLEADFEVQGTSTQSQLRVVNGEVTSWVDLLITLRPRRTGVLTIPALEIGGERSEPITINVRSVPSNLQNEIDKLVYFEITVDRDEVYVQAQLRYTRRLYYTAGVQIYGDMPGAPVIDNAVVLPLGETIQNITMKNDTRYGVLEQRYAIFPERSGQLTIPGFSVQSSVRLNEVRRGVRVLAADKTINVLPIPSTWPSDIPWFPAADLQIADTWTPDATTIKAGESLRRSVTITASGNTGSAIPEPATTLESPLLRQYPEAPVLEDDTRGESVTGRRTQTDGFVPAFGGDLDIPGVDVTWWDTESRRVRLSRLPARHLQILGEAPPDDVPGTDTQPSGETGSTPASDQMPSTDPVRWWPAVIAAILAIILVATRRFFMRTGHAPVHWFNAVNNAVRDKDLVGLREPLIRGAMQHFGLSRNEALRELTTDPDWQALLTSSNARFSADESPARSEPTLQAALALARRLKRTGYTRKRDPLPPLYPPV